MMTKKFLMINLCLSMIYSSNIFAQTATTNSSSTTNSASTSSNTINPESNPLLTPNTNPNGQYNPLTTSSNPSSNTNNATTSTNPSMPTPVSSSATTAPSAMDLLQAANNSNNNSATTTPNNPTQTCTPTGISFLNKQAILNTDNNSLPQRIFLIHNMTNYIVLLNHTTSPNPGASAGWGSKLEPGKYSAIAMNQRNFSLACMAYNPPQFGVIDCRSALDICGLPAQKNNVGSFWVAENMTKDQVQKTMEQRNVLPK